MGFGEAHPYIYTYWQALDGKDNLYCKSTGLSLTENGFRMELEMNYYNPLDNVVEQTNDWVLYGTKTEGLADISELNRDDYT